ncbi:MAG TPA: phytoene desaturase family protein [Sandaracinaceae bacterium LLY-WYZ-13_1]|nr:phytoene desaturase family protein [Sandaracinaceae bacterium LLY-WYZ-13_1]
MVGAGVGGLACAVDLAARGIPVRVLERASGPGGKARTVEVDGVGVDAGPTVLTMPWVFDELFEAAGATFREAVPLERAQVLARHAWPDGTWLDLFAELGRAADAIGEVFGAAEARAYRAFRDDARRIFEISENAFLRSQRLTLGGIVAEFGAAGLAALARLDSHRSMWRSLERRFSDPRLRQLFGRYATYCGSSPFEAPATLNLITHVECEGVYRARGGMSGLMRGLARLARSLGVELQHDASVDRIVVERGRAVGVRAGGALHRAAAVVFNGDVSALGRGLLGAPAADGVRPTPRGARSLSAVTWAMRARPRGAPLLHHNVFFGDDYRNEFEALLRRGEVPADPTVYVCAQDRADVEIEPPDERILVLMNAPPNGDEPGRWDEAERRRCTTVMQKVLRRSGLSLEPTATVQTTPREFEARFPATGGALYGPRWKGATSVLARAGASAKVPGLYLAGGSVHPGPGVPMAALSGRLAAEKVSEDLGSIARSRTAATSGTTSTG